MKPQFDAYVFFFFLILFIYLFMAVLGLRFCARAFSCCGKWGPLFIAVRRPLTIVASLVAEHRLQTCRLSNCGSRAQLLRSMWDLPRPGLEPVSPALAGRLSTTAPPGKPDAYVLYQLPILIYLYSYPKISPFFLSSLLSFLSLQLSQSNQTSLTGNNLGSFQAITLVTILAMLNHCNYMHKKIQIWFNRNFVLERPS